jgi:hypothetical protein
VLAELHRTNTVVVQAVVGGRDSLPEGVPKIECTRTFLVLMTEAALELGSNVIHDD